MAMERRKYPSRAEDYELFEMIGDGGSAVVHRARCVPFDEIVAIKILDFERNSDLRTISHEAQTMHLIDHPNILKAHCSFVSDHNLWVVMPYMAGGSCLHIMKSTYPNGFEEVIIATVLREVLKGLEYLHQHGHMHRDIKAGNILVDASGGVKLGDFGVSASLFNSGGRQRTRNTFVGTPCWMAPEVMEQRNGYDFKADIWSFGITALELAHGHAPFSSQPPVKVFLMTLNNAPPSLESRKDKKFSKSFQQMIAACLVKDPTKRPTAHKLLNKSFFKQARSHEYIARKILEGLPSLVDRFQTLKMKEAELLAQKKMLDGEKEAMSQHEYKRGISNWNFDIEALKVEASLIPDNDDASGKDSEGCSNSSLELDTSHEDAHVENDGMMQRITDCHSSPDQPSKSQGPRSSDQNTIYDGLLQFHGNDIRKDQIPGCEPEIDERHLGHVVRLICDDHGTSTIPCSSDFRPPAASNSDDNDEKLTAKVQQRGRFKVTSEKNLDIDKPLPSPGHSKSPSAQLEAAEEREKLLLVEIADLQRRLMLSEEEVKRTKANLIEVMNLKGIHDVDNRKDVPF